MKLETVTIAKRKFALAFTLDAFAYLEEHIADFNFESVFKYARSPRWLPDLLYIMAQQGELLEGRQLDVDRAWFGAHISPAPVQAIKYQVAAMNAVAAGLRMDTETGDDAEVDVVLEEIKKKEPEA